VDRAARLELRGWLVAVADGDRAAFDPLFTALWPVVTAYCERLLGDRAAAEDTAQDALTRVFTRAGEYDAERDALTWVLAIATWQVRTTRRWRQRRGEVALAAAPEPTTDARGAAIDRDLIAAAVAAVGELAPTDAATITAAILDDDEARAGLAPATFRKRLERSLGRLRSIWRSRHGEI
jgi:DNA-directed RNA polymerase specialized sigma24 family protein